MWFYTAVTVSNTEEAHTQLAMPCTVVTVPAEHTHSLNGHQHTHECQQQGEAVWLNENGTNGANETPRKW